ncbi:glucose uptake inhibitor SgrT [Salmonella bongori]|uniref:Glucose uptake inhibitor SgrT n=1 Tax=Salmonella bongori TaxID=54736 RepID=A0A8F8FN55_SALBN|nr:glucose uptake inhibitor SgrT [Salmonella bongori]EGE4653046.1 glucose uptake inhibitor SgrT [Salmonella bongori serovar 40:z35:- str. 95-0123]EGE4657569.1 glucose uptake inhibitor SgrT [Salmonella bongori serovar 48:i:- str. 94-0708]ECG1190896.1 glucose uptake inhibitor SgrT [Salmonella bongori]ECG8258705.1 glucose uptake inhibitor SgrT [Salmonella bongori serovar 48:i:-]ECG9252741.1 glucose uptake inhibitor SgrT [Salmonella bongori]
MRQFWLRYFAATENVSWLACLSALQRLKMLEELMQWEAAD